MTFAPGLGRVFPAGTHIGISGGWWKILAGRNHLGVDLPIAVGKPIQAVASGRVMRAQPTDSGEAGIFAAIEHPSGLISRYLHQSKLLVGLGQRVSKGQIIGFTGMTGNTAAPHLHFDLKAPLALLPAIEAAGGKPSTGWGRELPGFGWGVPTEPWLPVDSYSVGAVQGAAATGVRLQPDMPIQLASADTFVKLAIAGGAAWLLYRYAFT